MKRYLIAAGLLVIAGGVIAAEINDLSPVDASNTARFPENMAPSAVNDGARALEAIIARDNIDQSTRVTSSGTATAFTVAASQTITAYWHGLIVGFTVHTTNTGTQTSLNVDSVGAATINKITASDGIIPVPASELPAGAHIQVVYDLATASWQLLTGGSSSTSGLLTAANNLSDVADAPTARANLSAAVSTVTTEGDIILGSSAGVEARLPIGGANEILTSNATTLAYAATSTVIPAVLVRGVTTSMEPFDDSATKAASHGLTSVAFVQCYLTNISAEIGYDVGDWIMLSASNTSDAAINEELSIVVDPEGSLTIVAGNSVPEIMNIGDFANTAIDKTKWNFHCIPYGFQ